MRAGPKNAADSSELDLSHLPADPAERAMQFMETYLRVPKGHGATEKFRVRDWQEELIQGMLAPGVRAACVVIPRGNGKSTLLAALAVYTLFSGEQQSDIYCAATTEQQARIVWRSARRMVETSPELRDRAQIYRDLIKVPSTDSTLSTLPTEPNAVLGLDPALVVVDELAVVPWGMWESLLLASGKRPSSLVIGITTEGGHRDTSPLHRLKELGEEGTDKQFFYKRYAAPDGCALDDESAWEIANPGLDDILSRDALRAALTTSRESAFRTYRLNQDVGQEDSWIAPDLWDRCERTRTIPKGTKVVAGFDGSTSDDATVLICATVEPTPHVWIHSIWEKPEDAPEFWRVPREQVNAAVDRLFSEYKVLELACDPWHFRTEVENWERAYKKVLEWPTNSLARMGPASDRAYTQIVDQQMTHDGDERLTAHVLNAVGVQTPAGTLIRKDERKRRVHKIDAAVAMIIALDRAAHHRKKSGGRTAAFNAR